MAAASHDPAAPARALLAPLKTLFYVVGAQKSGTTWLHAMLIEHPEVKLQQRKEIHYWDTVRAPFHDRWRVSADAKLAEVARAQAAAARGDEPETPASRRARQRAEDYAAIFVGGPYDPTGYAHFLMRDRDAQPVAGDITPAYALLPASAFRDMADLHPNSRFIFLMRDPVRRLWSSVRMNFDARFETSLDDLRPLLRFFHEALEDPDNPLHRRSAYERTIETLERAVPAERILYLFYEELFQQSAADRLADFLGVARFAPAFERRVKEGRAAGGDLPADDAAAARRAFAATYAFIRARFGDRAPAAWMRPD